MDEYTTVRHQEMTFDQQDAGEVRELAAEIVRLNKERNATVPFSVYFYDFGGESNRMFVQDYGTNRAQLEQGRQKDHELMAGAEYDAWSARVEELLRPITVTYGELVSEASHQPADAREDTK